MLLVSGSNIQPQVSHSYLEWRISPDVSRWPLTVDTDNITDEINQDIVDPGELSMGVNGRGQYKKISKKRNIHQERVRFSFKVEEWQVRRLRHK